MGRANPLRYRKRVNGSILPKVQARRISIPTAGDAYVRRDRPAGHKPKGGIDMFKKFHQTFRHTITICVACMSFCLVSLDSHAASSVLSVFETDSEGWGVADWNPDLSAIVVNYSVTWHANGGNPGGYISSTDPSGNWFWFTAPAKFLGNQAAAYGYSLHLNFAPKTK